MCPDDVKEKFIVLSQFKLSDSGEVIKRFFSDFSECNLRFQACFLAVPYAYLSPIKTLIDEEKIVIGSREMNNVEPGSFTEAISAKMLSLKDCRFVLLGLYENRKFGENDESINKKIHKALESNLTPFLCIGENFEQFENHETEAIITTQIQQRTKNFNVEELKKIVFVCEAPWMDAILKDLTEDFLIEHYEIYRNVLKKCLGEDVFSSIQIIYKISDKCKAPTKIVKALNPQGFYALHPAELLTFLQDEAFDSLFYEKSLQPPLKNFEALETINPLEDNSQELSAVFSETNDIHNVNEEKESFNFSEEENVKEEVFEDSLLENSYFVEKNNDFSANEFFNEEKNTSFEDVTDENKKASVDEKPIFEDNELTNDSENVVFEDPLPTEKKEVLSALESEEKQLEESFKEKLSSDNLEDSKTKEYTDTQKPFVESVYESDSTIKEKSEESSFIATENDFPPIQSEDTMAETSSKASIEENNEKLIKFHKELFALYEELDNKVKTYKHLKQELLEKNQKIQQDLNLIDPVIAKHINLGDVAFFKENPQKAVEASEVLDEILAINALAQKIGAIPYQVSALNLKAKDVRRRLEEVWKFFTAHWQEIKRTFPELLPNLPELLKNKEPDFDLSVLDSFTLLGNRIRLMNL